MKPESRGKVLSYQTDIPDKSEYVDENGKEPYRVDKMDIQFGKKVFHVTFAHRTEETLDNLLTFILETSKKKSL